MNLLLIVKYHTLVMAWGKPGRGFDWAGWKGRSAACETVSWHNRRT